jgi:hypothetical protein
MERGAEAQPMQKCTGKDALHNNIIGIIKLYIAISKSYFIKLHILICNES